MKIAVPLNQATQKKETFMAYRTENALRFAPGEMFNFLDQGGMIIDRNSGEYVEADEIIKDPDHIWQFDCFDESHLGGLKAVYVVSDDADADDNNVDSLDEPETDPVPEFMDAQEELSALIAAQEADEASTRFVSVTMYDEERADSVPVTCTKGRHREHGTSKNDDGRRYNPKANHGAHGRQIYKDRRLRNAGSGKIRIVPTVAW